MKKKTAVVEMKKKDLKKAYKFMKMCGAREGDLRAVEARLK